MAAKAIKLGKDTRHVLEDFALASPFGWIIPRQRVMGSAKGEKALKVLVNIGFLERMSDHSHFLRLTDAGRAYLGIKG